MFQLFKVEVEGMIRGILLGIWISFLWKSEISGKLTMNSRTNKTKFYQFLFNHLNVIWLFLLSHIHFFLFIQLAGFLSTIQYIIMYFSFMFRNMIHPKLFILFILQLSPLKLFFFFLPFPLPSSLSFSVSFCLYLCLSHLLF